MLKSERILEGDPSRIRLFSAEEIVSGRQWIRKISRACNHLPRSLDVTNEVDDFSREDPIASGGFSDVYKGSMRKRAVALKVIRKTWERNHKRIRRVSESSWTSDIDGDTLTGALPRGSSMESSRTSAHPFLPWSWPKSR